MKNIIKKHLFPVLLFLLSASSPISYNPGLTPYGFQKTSGDNIIHPFFHSDDVYHYMYPVYYYDDVYEYIKCGDKE